MLHKERHLVECFINRIKRFRRIALRCEKTVRPVADLRAAVMWYASKGFEAAWAMICNGSGFNIHIFRGACAVSSPRRIRAQLYTHKTNGKAERFIQTAMCERLLQAPIKLQMTAQPLCAFRHIAMIGRGHTQPRKSKLPISRMCLDGNNPSRFHS